MHCNLLHYGSTYKSFDLKQSTGASWKKLVLFAHNPELEGRERIFLPYHTSKLMIFDTIHPMIANNMLSSDLIVDTDHGQGSMWCAVKLILQYNDNETKTIVMTCAKIPCKKEFMSFYNNNCSTNQPVNI